MDVWFRPLDDKAVIQLNVESVKLRYAMPTKIGLWDAQGKVILDSSVFMAGQRLLLLLQIMAFRLFSNTKVSA